MPFWFRHRLPFNASLPQRSKMSQFPASSRYIIFKVADGSKDPGTRCKISMNHGLFYHVTHLILAFTTFFPESNMVSIRQPDPGCVTWQNTPRFPEYFVACPRIFAAVCNFEYHKFSANKVASFHPPILKSMWFQKSPLPYLSWMPPFLSTFLTG